VIAVEASGAGGLRRVQSQQLAGVRNFVTQHIGAAKKAATLAF